MIQLRPVTHKYAYCGPACLQMVLEYFGIRETQKKIGKIAGTTITSGTSHKGMIRALRSFGFFPFAKHTTSTFNDIRKFVKKQNIPVIVNWYSAFEPPANGHYSVVTDIDRKTITLMDPEIRTSRKLTLEEFNQLWFDFDEDLAFKKPPIRTVFRWMLAAIPPKKKAIPARQKTRA
ncbi:MAG: cysteine peptidase family C39 domain-containing protein [bacterium]|nr:cysteine peptidase family C39 domain-containing protein [bacterium]